MQENLETNPENLRITEQHPEILKQPEILQSLLIPMEAWCLKTLLTENRPFSTAELHSKAVIELWVSSLRELPKSDELRELVELTSETGYKPYKAQLIRNPMAKEVKQIREDLQQKGIKYPSYEKVDNILEGLQSWGIFTKRYGATGKAKYFWVLQPAFLTRYGKRIRRYLEKQEIGIIW